MAVHQSGADFYNELGKHTVLISDRDVPVGKSTLSYVFTTTAEGKGALFINETKVAEAGLALSPTRMISWEGFDVGRDPLSPVSSGYAGKGQFAFTPGALEKVVIKVERQSPAVPCERGVAAQRLLAFGAVLNSSEVILLIVMLSCMRTLPPRSGTVLT